MTEPRIMAVLAHPDDETLGVGGSLARYSAEGVGTYVVTATRGERGRIGEERPGPRVAAPIRETELRSAAAALGVREVSFLDYVDQEVDRADPREAIARIVARLRRVRPQVVLTFDPYGGYGHPDHIAVSQFTTAAVAVAADPSYEHANGSPHRVAKLYYMAWGPDTWSAYEAAFRKLTSTVDGVERQARPWPAWSLTTRIDTREHWPAVWRAVQCHESQMGIYDKLGQLSDSHHESLWGVQEFYRAMSLVNGGRALETDLFEGLR